jgi:hypothetical protein
MYCGNVDKSAFVLMISKNQEGQWSLYRNQKYLASSRSLENPGIIQALSSNNKGGAKLEAD